MHVDHHRREDYDRLRELLKTRRAEVADDLQRRLARIRDASGELRTADPLDDAEVGELDLALVEFASATLQRIDTAMNQLDEGRYGRCTRCHRAIGEARLRAMPFAVRCRECELAREGERRDALPRRRLWGASDVTHGISLDEL